VPTFFFHIVDGDKIIRDAEGVDLPGAKAALEEARHAARELLADKVRRGAVIDGQAFHVEDELGKPLFTLPFKDVLRLE
jgi:hypothetical protein